MDLQQKQEYQQRPVSYDSAIFKKILCPKHNYKYLYRCLYHLCDKYVCGKMECIDEHFHDNQLKIVKIDLKDIIKKLQYLQKSDLIFSKIVLALQSYEKQINSIKQVSSQVFSLYKKQKQILCFLKNKDYQLLDNDYLQELQNLQKINENLQGYINLIRSKINWKNIWINIDSQFNIIQKLKLDLKEFSSFYLQSIKLDIEQLDKRWIYLENYNQFNQGLIIVYFTKQHFIIGQYISNTNVQTGFMFLDSFIFVIDPETKIYKDKIVQIILEYKDNLYGHTYEPDILFHLNLALKPQKNTDYSKDKQMNLKVIRVQSFLCTK